MKKAWAIAPYNFEKPIWEDVWQFDYNNNHISVGWDWLGNVIGLNENQIKEKARTQQPADKSAHPGEIARQFRFFDKEIKIGDIILARKGMRQVVGLGVVTGKPYYDRAMTKAPNIPSYRHPNFLPVKWMKDFKPIKYNKNVFLRHTIEQFKNPKILKTIESYFRLEPSDSAIDDIPAAAPIGCESPHRTESSGWRYQRNDEVRKHILRQAKGTCEYCGKLGFLLPNGNRYLETHHIIALGKQGPDTVDNVIALCPSDHREAHYGKRRDSMEAVMLKIIKKRQTATN